MPYFFRPTLAILLVLGLITTAQANLQTQRDDFVKAESALNKGYAKTWNKLKKGLESYPLYADLLFKLAIQKIDSASSSDADANQAALANTPLQKTYRKSWLNRLAQQKRWQDYLRYHQENLGTRYRCYHANALYETGKAPVGSRAFFENVIIVKDRES